MLVRFAHLASLSSSSIADALPADGLRFARQQLLECFCVAHLLGVRGCPYETVCLAYYRVISGRECSESVKQLNTHNKYKFGA